MSDCDLLQSLHGANVDSRPALFFLTVIAALLIVVREAPSAEPQHPIAASSFLQYQNVEGYFLQDDPRTEPFNFNYVRARGRSISGVFLLASTDVGNC